MPNFRTRSEQPELMDDPAAPEAELRLNLREIERINQLLGGYKVIFNALKKIPGLGKAFSVLDVGCGSGDTLRAVYHYTKQKQWQVDLRGLDLNPVMIAMAREESKNLPLTFSCANVFAGGALALKADVVTASLFCHHFPKKDLIQLLQRLRHLAAKAVIINDLHRHPLAYHSIKLLTRLFSHSRFTRHDAPLSVARAFTRQDWVETLAEAGIGKYRLTWCWAFRWQVIITVN